MTISKKQIEDKENEIMLGIVGDNTYRDGEILIGDTLINIGRLPIPAIERLSELYSVYPYSQERKNQEAKPFTAEAVQKQLEQAGLEVIACGSPFILSDITNSCRCDYHQIEGSYKRTTDPKAKIGFNFDTFYVAGLTVGLKRGSNENERGRVYTLQTGFDLPINITLFSKGGLFSRQYDEQKVTKAMKKSLEDTSRDLTEANLTLDAIDDIASKYGIAYFILSREGTRLLSERTSLLADISLSKQLVDENSVSQFGQAIVELTNLARQKPYKSKIRFGQNDQNKMICHEITYEQKLKNFMGRMENATARLGNIKMARPSFEDYHKLMQGYLKEEAPFF